MSQNKLKSPCAFLIFIFFLINQIVYGKDSKQLSTKFAGPEIYKTKWNIPKPVIGDVNHDGRKDILIIDNFKGKIEILIQKDLKEGKKKPKQKKSGKLEDINKIDYDKRFEKKFFLAEDKILGLHVSNLFNSKQKVILYVSYSEELIILEYEGKYKWTKKLELECPRPHKITTNLLTGDFNDDNKKDIVVLGVKGIYVFYQQKANQFSKAVKYSIHSDNLPFIQTMQVLDVNGDKKDDICFLVRNNEKGIIYRLQTSNGQFTPAISLSTPKSLTSWFGYIMADVPPEKNKLVTCSLLQKSRSLSLSSVHFPELNKKKTQKNKISVSNIYNIAFEGDSKSFKRDITWGDVNNDGRIDFIGTEPASAQVTLFLQDESFQFGKSVKFPSLMDARQISVYDWDDKKGNEIYVLSKKEGVLGVSHYKKDSVTFPKTLSLDGSPQCFLFHTLDSKAKKGYLIFTTLYYEKEEKDNKKKKKKKVKLVIQKSAGEKPVFEFIFPKKTPTFVQIKAGDVNQDQLTDLILFEEYDSPRIFLQQKDFKFIELTSNSNFKKGLLVNTKPYQFQWLSLTGKRDQIQFSIASKNFIRLVKANQGGLEALNQLNSSSSLDLVKSAIVADLNGDKVSEMVLFNSSSKTIDIYTLINGKYSKSEEVKIGKFRLKSLAAEDVNHDGIEDILIIGKTKIGILYGNIKPGMLKRDSHFEPEEKLNINYNFLMAADLIKGDNLEVIALDSSKHLLEIFHITKKYQMESIIRIKIFEENHFSGSSKSGIEPRYILIDDVTGDQKNDIILVAHDNILIYPNISD